MTNCRVEHLAHNAVWGSHITRGPVLYIVCSRGGGPIPAVYAAPAVPARRPKCLWGASSPSVTPLLLTCESDESDFIAD